MTEEQTTKDAWREVGWQFQVLGESLAQAFRTAWEDEENRQHLQDMQAGLEKMISEIGQALTISEKTVKTHVSNILSKLRLADRTQAAIYAHRHGVAPE